MAAKVKLTAEEHAALPEPVQAFYKKTKDGFVLDPEGIEDIGALSGAYDATRKEVKELRAQADKLKQIDPDEYRRLKKEAEEREEQAAEMKRQSDALVAQINEKHSKETNRLQEQLAALSRQLDDDLIDRSISDALSEHKASRLLGPAIRPSLRINRDAKTKRATVEVINDEGVTVMNEKGDKPASVSEYVGGLRKDKEFARLFDATGASGSGANGNQQRPQAGASGPGNSPLDKIKRGTEALFRGGGAITGNTPNG